MENLDGLGAFLVAIVAVGAALGIAWPVARSKTIQQRQALLAETNATLQTALDVERRERREDNERNAHAIADLRTDCARETAALAGKVEVLTGQFAAQLATQLALATSEKVADAVVAALAQAIGDRRTREAP